MAGYYDVVLGLIPLALVGITGTLFAAGLALSLAIPVAGVVAIGLIGHAMFVRTPANPPRGASARGEGAGFDAAD